MLSSQLGHSEARFGFSMEFEGTSVRFESPFCAGAALMSTNDGSIGHGVFLSDLGAERFKHEIAPPIRWKLPAVSSKF